MGGLSIGGDLYVGGALERTYKKGRKKDIRVVILCTLKRNKDKIWESLEEQSIRRVPQETPNLLYGNTPRTYQRHSQFSSFLISVFHLDPPNFNHF